MSSSDKIKEAIVNYFNGTGLPGSKEADWKRRDKRTLPGGETFRMYENAKLNRTVYTIGDDEDAQIVEADQWIYAYIPAGHDGGQGAAYLAFEPEDRWRRTGYQYDQHQLHSLQTLFQLPGDFDEASENIIDVPARFNQLTIHMFLKKLGFKSDQSYTDFMNDPNHKSPGPQAGIVPTTSMQPYFLNPNFSAPLQPAAAPAPQGVRVNNLSPGSQNATRQAQQAAMMASIGQMAAQLGATGGIQIGNTHIPAAPIGSMTPLATPAPSNYPELAGQQLPVQIALIASRMNQQLGLTQEGNWADEDSIQKDLDAGTEEIEIERSGAIWLLYEHWDNNQGVVFPDFFNMSNDELEEELSDIFDMDEDNQYFSVPSDGQPYPAPYDLPEPLPAPTPAYQPPATGNRPPPMVGPAGINARSGSFAAPQAPPPAQAPVAPPAGNVQAHATYDSGDKWAEFCGEAWGFYEANKANLPMDLSWSDNYREREAHITGLGYQFERLEYTGVMVRMGYVGRDGQLITNIDLPSSVLSELLVEWGGDWNVDDITQFINKRKGEDPETGFSYSASQGWEEVKAHLDSQGWKEVE